MESEKKKMHKYEIIGTWVYNGEIESEKPREKMLDVYAPILEANKENAVFVKGECHEIIACDKCNNYVGITDCYCKYCGHKLDRE